MMKNAIRKYLSKFLSLEKYAEKNDQESARIKELEDRVLNAEEKMIEMSRVIATIAIAHASLLRDLGRIAESLDSKKKPQQARKIEDDFTN